MTLPRERLAGRNELRPGDRPAAVRPRRRFLLPILGPRRPRPRHREAVDPDLVYLLVEETEIALDLRAFRDRIGVIPDEVAEHLVPDFDRMVAGLALVRAASDRLARNEKLHPHVVGRDVIAGRQPRLEKKPRTPSLGNDLAANNHLHRAG